MSIKFFVCTPQPHSSDPVAMMQGGWKKEVMSSTGTGNDVYLSSKRNASRSNVLDDQEGAPLSPVLHLAWLLRNSMRSVYKSGVLLDTRARNNLAYERNRM
ncbi:hypothetical protein QCA50_001565 [Cerrena zonata]|uniref:Uncharacterized protein n=1 Tax=Cerrena zonata TaxID=2478898 RepID=A0AAW0GRC5_9APHY